MSKIGIVMANYKMQHEWVRQAVQSIQAQSIEDWKLYIVGVKEHDEPEESTVHIQSLTLQDERIEVIYADRPYVYQQRNVGMEKALRECKYVTFFDSDDFMLPNKFELELHIIELEVMDIVFSSYYYTDSHLTIFKHAKLRDRVAKHDILESCWIPDYSLLSSEFAMKHLYRPDTGLLNWQRYKTGCVYDMWIRAVEHDARVGKHAAPTWLYRQREQSLGKQLNAPEMLDRELAIRDAKERWGVTTPTKLTKGKLWNEGDAPDY